MAFTERVEHKLEIIPPYSIIQCRTANVVEKDGVEVGRTYHRGVYVPGSDVSAACEDVKKVSQALWTASVIAEYEAHIASQQADS